MRGARKDDQPKGRENKKPLKSIKRNNVKNDVIISNTVRGLQKKIRQSDKNNATRSAAADLLNSNVANVTETRENSANDNNKASTTLETKNKKRGVKSKPKNQSGKTNKKKQNVKGKKIGHVYNNSTKSTAVDLLNLNIANIMKTRGNNGNNNKKTGTTLQTSGKKKGVKSKQNSQSGKNDKHTGGPTKNQHGKAKKNIVAAKEKSRNILQTKSQAMKMKKEMKEAIGKNENRLDNLKTLNNKEQKQEKPDEGISSVEIDSDDDHVVLDVSKVARLIIKPLEDMFGTAEHNTKRRRTVVLTAERRDTLISTLRAKRFRSLNEVLYNNDSAASKRYFKEYPDAFKAYHDGYKQQIEQWPLNPLDTIISSIKAMPKHHVIADFGCGEARLASAVSQIVHSIDFVSLNEMVMACDMAHTSLLTGGVDVVVFCLSLLGTNLCDYLMEANRVLKKDGVLKIAEVESRFDKVDDFINLLSEYGFKNTSTDLSHNLFYFLDFKKKNGIAGKIYTLPPVTLKPFLYL